MGEPVAACLTDGIAFAFVFVVGRDVADAGVQPDGVVLYSARARSSSASSSPGSRIFSSARRHPFVHCGRQRGGSPATHAGRMKKSPGESPGSGQSTMSARRVISSGSPTAGLRIRSVAPMSANAVTVSLTPSGPAAMPPVTRPANSSPPML